MLSTQKPSKKEKSVILEKDKTNTQPIQNPSVNVINITNIETLGNNNLLVEHNKDTFTFTIKNRDTVIGTFSCGQIFKYLNQDIDNFLLDVTLGTSLDIIQKYLCKYENDELVLISHTESPITGNIDILVKLYKDLYEYESNKIPLELEKIDINIREEVRFKNREFIYTILLQIIKLFSSYTSSNIVINQQVKDLIMKYTIGAVYKLSVMVKDDIDYNLMYIKSLTSDMEDLNKIRNNMQGQINSFKESLEIENTKIDNIILNLSTSKTEIPKDYLIGGKLSSTTSSLMSTSMTKTSDTKSTDIKKSEETNIKSKFSSHTQEYSKTDSITELSNSSTIDNVTTISMFPEKSKNISKIISSSFLTDTSNNYK
jgi:hypothetical protein